MPNVTAPDDAAVYFIKPVNGDIIDRDESEQITVVFGLKDMQVAPAGVGTPNSGHHHLLINLDQLPNLNAPLPASDQVVHFGKGQTSTSLKLPPGKHRLQLILGNQVHIPHDPPVISEVIEIEVR
jgi:hypothetical protein